MASVKRACYPAILEAISSIATYFTFHYPNSSSCDVQPLCLDFSVSQLLASFTLSLNERILKIHIFVLRIPCGQWHIILSLWDIYV